MPADLVTEQDITDAWAVFASLPANRRAALIAAASAAVSSACGWEYGYDEYDEVLRPADTRILRLRARPIVLISAIESGLSGSRVELTATDYAVLRSGRTGEVELYRGFPGGFTYPDQLYGGHPGYGDVRIVYTAGYVAVADDPDDVDEDHPARPVCPADLKEAVIAIAKAMHQGVKSAGLRSETWPEYSYTLDTGSGGPGGGSRWGWAIPSRYVNRRPA